MKHPATRELFAYWDKCRGDRALPDRSDIEPSEIRRILADTFIVACDGAAGYPFRLAGTRMCALFGRELRATPFMDLWETGSRAAVKDVLASTVMDHAGAVASVSAGTADERNLRLELLLLPLRHQNQPSARIIGALAPMESPYWLDAIPLRSLGLGGLRHVGPATDENGSPHFIAASARALLRHGLVVHEGGRRD